MRTHAARRVGNAAVVVVLHRQPRSRGRADGLAARLTRRDEVPLLARSRWTLDGRTRRLRRYFVYVIAPAPGIAEGAQ